MHVGVFKIDRGAKMCFNVFFFFVENKFPNQTSIQTQKSKINEEINPNSVALY